MMFLSVLLLSMSTLGSLQVALGASLVKPPRPSTRPATTIGKRVLRHSDTELLRCTNTEIYSDGKPSDLRWNQFFISLDESFEKWEHDVINEAMLNIWQIIPCVTFGIYSNDTSPTEDHVVLVKGTNNGCNSIVGRQGGPQTINLQSPGCITVGMVMHQFLHTLGFHHEQCRSDRDDYVNILWDNIIPEHMGVFNKLQSSSMSSFNVSYDYNSIMHSDGYAFSKNGKATMIAKNGQRLWNTGKLQETDIQKLQAMYPC